MEKVWAKVNGNYENVIAGDPNEAFKLLLGAPGVDYYTNYAPISYNASLADTDPVNVAAINAAWNIISSAD